MNPSDIDTILVQKMAFIYNALQSGWTVRAINRDKFEFTKDDMGVKKEKEVNLKNYLEKFIKFNMNIDNIS